VAAALLALPASASAEDIPFIDWSSWLPPTPGTYQPSSEDACRSGKPQCVDKVIKAMTARFDAQAATCDHDAMFALTYLRTTEEYQRAMLTPGFFTDPNFVNHEDAVFAGYYFDAYDQWHHGDRSKVPAAWRIALDAADKKQVTGAGDMLLGINAHINRDLPYVLAGIGLVKPDGTSRKPDHDKVNEFLNKVTPGLFPELARRFDPTVDDTSLPGPVDDMLTFQAFPAMREAAWRNAERLVNATTPLARSLVEKSIEDSAALTAQTIRAATANPPLSGGSASRDAYCAAHHDD
jgi:hypothetical protein